jgi:ABC-type branched-subunit amino acid transport system substrate-binding protein
MTLVVAFLLGTQATATTTLGSALGPGVSRDTIRIGYHAPFTGAAPLPTISVERASKLFWQWREFKDRPINGRHVETVIMNDNYNPSQAVAVCKEMVEERNVFMLSGVLQATGPDQIQACARYAASVGVPYLSLGSTKIGLKGLPRYFAMSATWPKQSRMLADRLVSDLGARRDRNGMLRFGTPNFEDAHDAFIRAMRDRNAEVHYDRSISKASGANEARAVVQEMQAADIDNVFVLTSPAFFIQLLDAADQANYYPLWTGIGITMTVGDTVVRTACRNGGIGRVSFLSPVPAFAGRDRFDLKHDRAMRAIYNEKGDSITWLGWATSVATAKMLDRAGRDLTRRRFVRRLEGTGGFKTAILPRFRFRPNDHFGGNAIHVLRARCNDKRWHTVRTFVRDF